MLQRRVYHRLRGSPLQQRDSTSPAKAGEAKQHDAAASQADRRQQPRTRSGTPVSVNTAGEGIPVTGNYHSHVRQAENQSTSNTDDTNTIDQSIIDLFRASVAEQIQAQQLQRELLVQGFANTSLDLKAHTTQLFDNFAEIHNSLKLSLQNFSEILIDNVSDRNSGRINFPTNPIPNIPNGNVNTATTRSSDVMNNPGNSLNVTPPSTASHPLVITQAATPPCFRDSRDYNPVTFIKDLEKYFKRANIPAHRCLEAAIDCLSGSAANWAAIYSYVWSNFGDFKRTFLRTYWSDREQEKIKREIITGSWAPGHFSMSDHFAYFVNRAQLLTKPFSETELVMYLMRHYPANTQALFALTGRTMLTEAADFLQQQESIHSFQGNSQIRNEYVSAQTVRRPATAGANPYNTDNRPYQQGSSRQAHARNHPYKLDRRAPQVQNPARQVNAVQFVPATSSCQFTSKND